MSDDRSRRARRGGSRNRKGQPEYLAGVHSVREALRARRRELLRLWVDPAARRGEVARLCEDAEGLGVPIREAPADDWRGMLDVASRRANVQGVMLEAGSLPSPSLDDLIESLPVGEGCLVALDEVEDPQNVGALIRVAEASGAQGLILLERRAPPLSGAVSRASAGALEWLPVCRVGNLSRALQRLQDAGAWVVGADQDAEETLFSMSDRVLSGRLVVVMGSEGRGLRGGIRRQLDHVVSVPMRGRVGSLNVSTAGAVILYELLRRRELE
jgi:23S rRNA (guanosine2251-2'-O)-methyltransferase